MTKPESMRRTQVRHETVKREVPFREGVNRDDQDRSDSLSGLADHDVRAAG